MSCYDYDLLSLVMVGLSDNPTTEFLKLLNGIFNNSLTLEERSKILEKYNCSDLYGEVRKELEFMTAREREIQEGMQEGMQKGMQKGMQEGMQKGIQEGIIAIISTLKELNMPRDFIIATLVEKFNVSLEQAKQYYISY